VIRSKRPLKRAPPERRAAPPAPRIPG
jgi:hypothetical protein